MTDPLTILLVDDSPHDRGLVRRELSQEFRDAVFIEVTNKSDFETTLSEQHFDIVITDYEIRWTDGLAVLHAVKLAKPECPVLMFTATGTEEIAVKAMKNGLDDYIIKNVHHMVRLRAAVQSILDHQSTRLRAERLESRLGDLLRNLQLGVFRRDISGAITEANEAAATIFGFDSVDELIGQRLADLLVLPNGLSKTHADPSLPIHTECLLNREGETVWASVVERAATDSDLTFDGIVEDVTARRESEEQLARVRDEMAHVARVNTMAAMASGISHELNQPLSSIANFAAASSLLLQEPTPNNMESLAEHIDQIHNLALSSGEIIKGLRAFTTRSSKSDWKPVSVSDLVTRTVTMMQFELSKAGVDLDLIMPETDPLVRGDAIQIQQVLVNLLSNAISAMSRAEQGDRLLTIRVEHQPDAIVIDVVDTGTGIADELLNQLFDPFVSSYTDGTGMGLCISSRIAEAHRGNLDAWNNDQSGATFRLSLPLDTE